MSAATLTLTDFLLARITEDEAVARDLIAEGPWAEFHERDMNGPTRDDEYSALDIGAGRVLAECEAYRKIVKRHRPMANDTGALHICHDEVADDTDCVELRALAAIYAGHPDYRDEWKL